MKLDDLPLNDILLFIALVEEESYSNAARKLGIDVSSLSKRIIRLEKHLQTQLVQRTTRQMKLTEAGHLLYQHALNLKNELQSLQNNITQLQDAPMGKLRIKAPHSLGTPYLVNVIDEFLQHYPKIQCELLLGSHSTNLIRDEVDILISIKPLDDINLIAKKIGNRGTGIYASPTYLKQHGIPKIPQDLYQHNCLIHLDRGEKNIWQFVIDQQIKRIAVKGSFYANTNATLRHAAEKGLGLVKLPSFLAEPSIEQKKLVSVLQEFCPPPTAIYAIYAKNRSTPAKIKLFIQYLKQQFEHLPLH
ncbi:MAG: LysR family transcriptional regulator [Gammaproteobacteria bacterium]|jgi:DNA-binding transcriptional LysR family regulator|nr:LysR family transcriptional regulator [Gammaproteobacteria bacterium]